MKFILWLLLILPCVNPALGIADTTYRVGAEKGPFFLCDTRVVEDRWLAERFTVKLQKHTSNPLVVKEHDWEGTGPLMGGSVLLDPEDSLYKMWYCVWDSYNYYNKLPFSYNMCYAESKDGIKWEKPALNVFKHKANPLNNYIHCGVDKTQNMDVCLNPRPDLYPGKFLAIHNQKGGVFVTYSDDGKTFTFLHDTPAIPYHSDTHNNFVYDEVRDNWFLFCRPRAYAGNHKRRVSMQQSKDLKKWTHDRTVLIPTETEKPEFYGMSVFRRGDLFFGTLKIYDGKTGFMHSEATWSADGEHWNQVPTHQPLLERGPEGTWDHGMVLVSESPVVVGDQMRFYYGGTAKNHKDKNNRASIGLAIAERDRFIGLRSSGEEPGYVLTRPFLFPKGEGLFVNGIIPKNEGMIRAELRNDNNKVIEGFSLDDCDPVDASGFAQPLTWNSKLISAAPVSEVRIRFELNKAQIFSYDFK